jgi:prepilin-type N-terminal cleavage/methylation domain-containing protein
MVTKNVSKGWQDASLVTFFDLDAFCALLSSDRVFKATDMSRTSQPSLNDRRAFSLIELICVLVVLGVMAAAFGSMRMSPKLVERQRVKQEAEYVSLALRSARTTAIAGGIRVRLDWYQNGDQAGFATTVEGADKDHQPPKHDFPAGMKTEWSNRSVTFAPDGSADTSLSIVLARPDAISVVELLSASGQVTVTNKE